MGVWKSSDSRAIFGEKPIQHPLATLSGLSNVIVEALIVLAGLQVTTSPPKEPQKSTSNNSEISNLRKNERFTISLQCSSRSKSTNPLYFPTSPLPLFAAATVSFNATLVFLRKKSCFGFGRCNAGRMVGAKVARNVAKLRCDKLRQVTSTSRGILCLKITPSDSPSYSGGWFERHPSEKD